MLRYVIALYGVACGLQMTTDRFFCSQKLSALLQLPDELRIDTARILLLRLTVPADLYRSPIEADIDGVDVRAVLQPSTLPTDRRPSRNRSPQSTRTPQHRKTNRRIQSPPPYDPGGKFEEREGSYVPNTEDLAKSFLQDEPLEEKRELEALYVSQTQARQPEESVISDTSDESGLGTGTGLGLPTFLANFLQGIVDRIQVRIGNVALHLAATIPQKIKEGKEGDANDAPTSLVFSISELDVAGISAPEGHIREATGVGAGPTKTKQHQDDHRKDKRRVSLNDLRIDLICEASAPMDPPIPPASPSPLASRHSTSPSSAKASSTYQSASSGSRAEASSFGSPVSARSKTERVPEREVSPVSSRRSHDSRRSARCSALEASNATLDDDRFADAGDGGGSPMAESANQFDIRPGEDNLSWASRRNRDGGSDDDLWSSSNDLPGLSASMIEDQDILASPQASQVSLNRDSNLGMQQSTSTAQEDPGLTVSMIHDAEMRPQTPESPTSPRLSETLYQSTRFPGDDPFVEDENQKSPVPPPLEHGWSPPKSDVGPADVAQSKLYSHEGMESMYMSALSGSHARSPETGRLPGQWESTLEETDDLEPNFLSQSARTLYAETSRQSPEPDDGTETPRPSSRVELLNVEPATPTKLESVKLEPVFSESGATEALTEQIRMSDPEPSDSPRQSVSQGAKRILTIDAVTMWLPNPAGSDQEAQNKQPVEARPSSRSVSVSSSTHQVPGAFSQYAEMTASRRLGSSTIQGSVFPMPAQIPQSSGLIEQVMEISVGIVAVQTDAPTAHLCYQLLHLVASSLSRSESGKAARQTTSTSSQSPLSLSLHVSAIHLGLVNELPCIPANAAASGLHTSELVSDGVLLCDLQDLRVDSKLGGAPPEVDVVVGRFSVGFAERDILSFTKPASTRLSASETVPPDLTFRMSSRATLQDADITQIFLTTLPIQLDLDLQRFDEAFNSFGGLSGVLELSASMMSSGTFGPKDSPASPQKKGVRFDTEPVLQTNTPEIKLNADFGGFGIRLVGHACSVLLQTSGVKLVSRPHAVSAAVSKVKLSGPHSSAIEEGTAPSVTLEKIRATYLFSPENEDLERLLALLTPSKNKYENDDDILLDTLLRQRRKGAALRLVIKSFQAQVSNWAHSAHLQALGEEMSKFAAVARYLPEDERPGLLTLAFVNEVKAQLPTNPHFGLAEVGCEDLQVAHVGLPALLAFSIGNVCVGRIDEPSVVHNLVSIPSSEKLPLIMARMIGDEAEPVIKIKLFNVCIEYSIPTFLALTGLDATAAAEEIVNDIATSVVALAGPPLTDATSHSDMQAESPTRSNKKLSVDLLLHDCALGLKPRDSAAKGLFVLNNTRFTTVIPPDETFEAALELRRASFFITDDDVEALHLHNQAKPTSSDRLTSALSAHGFVPAGSIMSARVGVVIEKDELAQSQSVSVDFSTQLIVLETCADSTQTLIAVLNGLSPPLPPSKEPKYRTEAMTMDDMMASFTGNAYAKPESPPSTIFDANDRSPPPEDDDLLAESELTESLYGPLDGFPDPEAGMGFEDEPQGHIAESLLEDDPFEMPNSPTVQRLSDAALLDSLHKQCLLSTSKGHVDLKPFYIRSAQLDKHYGTASKVLGAPYRFNTPAVPFPSPDKQQLLDHLPFRLRVRDVHVIWNLYDGYDWQKTRTAISDAVQEVETKAEEKRARRRRSGGVDEEEESVIEDFLFNSIYIGVPASRDAQELRRQINRNINDLASETESYAPSGVSRPTNYSSGQQSRPRARARRLKLERSKAHKVAFELKGVSADVLAFPPGSGETQNSIDVRVRDFEIFDNVPTSTWRKFLTYLHDEDNLREMMRPMIHIEMQNVRPVLDLAATEIVMRVSSLYKP